MKRIAVAGLIFLTLSCGRGVRTTVTPLPPQVEVLNPPAVSAREDSPGEAAAFELLRRTGGGELPVERLLEAQRHAARMPAHSMKGKERGANIGGWQPLGPGNVGGRTRSLVIRPDDPNTIYAGSVSGGVWKSTDGGGSWNPLTDLLPSIGIGTLAMDPGNPDTLYAGTGEWFTGDARGNSVRGAGIFKTTDGGTTWKLLEATGGNSQNGAFRYVNKIVVSPVDGRRVYAATYGGIWMSRDGGTSWQFVLNRTGSMFGCQDLVIRTDQATDYLFAGCAYTGGTNPAVYRNVDAAGVGKWEIVFTADNQSRTSLALAPSNQSVIYAVAASSERGDYSNGLLGVFRSVSNGDPGTWEKRVGNTDANRLNTLLFTNPREAFSDVCGTAAATYNNQGTYDNSIAVDPSNPDVVWVGGIDIFRSDDGGANWGIAAFWQASGPRMAHADVHGLVFAPGYNGGDNQTLWAATDGGIYRTDNALAPVATGERAACSPYPTQVAWINMNNGYSVTQYYHGSVYPGGGAYMGGAQDTGTTRGTDATGPNAWRGVIGGDGGFSAIDPGDPNVWYGESQNLSLLRTVNNGLSFFSATRGITESSSNFVFIAPFAMDPSESKRLYMGGLTLWKTTDGAQNWTEASAAVPSSSGLISAIAVSPADPNTVAFGTVNGFVYRSTKALTADKSTTWDSSRPRTGYVSRVMFDPKDPRIVYATYSQYKTDAAQNHVYRSTDGGATWTGIDGTGSTGLPDIPVFSLVADPQNPSTLYVGTDIGVFVSQDGGATWSRDDNPFANVVTETLTLDRSAGQTTLFAFTHGRGAWKTALPGSGGGCQYALSMDNAPMTAFGGTVTFDVTAGDGCAWSVIPEGAPFTVGSPAGGKAKGTVNVTVPMNLTAVPRVGNLVVQDKMVTVTQDAAQVAAGNDEAAGAFAVGLLPAVVIEDTRDATESTVDPVHSCTGSADKKTVWFLVKATDAGTLRMGWASRRFDNGADSGTVFTMYPVVNGAVGAQAVCSITPQATGVITTRFIQATVRPGDTFLVQISATLSGSPAGASLMGGNLSLSATVLK